VAYILFPDLERSLTALSGNSFVTLSLVYPTISHLIKKLQTQISDNNDELEPFDEFIPPANSDEIFIRPNDDDNDIDENVDNAFMETEGN